MSNQTNGGLNSTDFNSPNKHPQQAIDLLNGKLKLFFPHHERIALMHGLQGEESGGFMNTVFDLAQQIDEMPRTYQTDGQGNRAMVYLHYFRGAIDAWITELDSNPEQNQAFGKICMTGDESDAEWGYISIPDLTKNGVELDLYWTPKPLFEVLSETPDQAMNNDQTLSI